MKKTTGLTALLLILALTLSLTGCGLSKEAVMNVVAPTDSPEEESVGPVGELIEEEQDDSDRIACKEITGNFDPFTASTDGDLAVVNATQLPLMGREGEESPSVISEATNSDGSYTVTIELRSGLRCGGEILNADDLLFTYYVLLDPAYEGGILVNTLPILGVEDYYHGVNKELYQKYSDLFYELYQDGKYDQELQKTLQAAQEADPKDYNAEQVAQKAVDEYDNDKAADIRAFLQMAWRQDVAELVRFCMKNYGATVEYHTGYTLEQLRENKGLQIMYAMVETSFGTLTEDGNLVGRKTGKSWDLKSSFPTEDDFFTEMYESYGGSAENYWQIEGIGRGDLVGKARDLAVKAWAAQDENWDGGVRRIPGIERVGDRLIRVTMDHYDKSFLDTLCGVNIVPLHLYGDPTLYDYSIGTYGFAFGDVSTVGSRSGDPTGAGAYKLDSFDGKTAVLVKSSDYWTESSGTDRLLIGTEVSK